MGTRKEGATASLSLQPALPTSMRLSHAALFDLLGWHLTPSITNDGAWHLDLGAMATKQLRWPPGRPINWPVNAAIKCEHHSFFTDRPGGRALSRYPMRNSMFTTFYNP